jgi:hypothetical protein
MCASRTIIYFSGILIFEILLFGGIFLQIVLIWIRRIIIRTILLPSRCNVGIKIIIGILRECSYKSSHS